MYIKKFCLKNIRAFEQLEFDLTRADVSYAGWTVFTGNNGAGKSTILKAIAVALLGTDTVRALQPSFQGWIKHGAAHREGKISLDVVDGVPHGSQSVHYEISLQEHNRETLLSQPIHLTKQKPTGDGAWFACGYGPFRRVFGASPDAARVMSAPETERFSTLFQEAASLAEVDQWLRSLSHKKLEGRQSETRQLAIVIEILNDELMPNGMQIDRVDSDGLWLKDAHGCALAWGEMSDGYRTALALLADILRHLFNTFGEEQVTQRDKDGKLSITAAGVVLIDEVDAHLHPDWQREIGFWLKRHFPRLQFLVTTHSPLICQAADQNGLFVLPSPASLDAARALTGLERQKIISARPDTILLSPAFGLENTRSSVAVAARADFAKLQSKKRAGVALDAHESAREQEILPFVENGED